MAGTPRVAPGAALTWRMGRQRLLPAGAEPVVPTVDRLVAVASQLEPSWAELGLRLRSSGIAAGDVEAAVADGALLRTFALRGALHLMSHEQAAAHLALRSSSRMWERRSWVDFYRLNPEDWPALRAVVRDALSDGPLSRAALGSAVASHAPYAHLESAFTDDSGTFLKPFAWWGDLTVIKDPDGGTVLRGLAGDPRWPGLLPVDAAGEHAITAYLRAYGPATADNLAYWLTAGLGVRRAHVTRWLEALAGRLREVEVAGETRLVLAEDLEELLGTVPVRSVHLLPRYDQWVLGPGTADELVVPPAIRADVSRGQNPVVVDGVVAGTWSQRGDGVQVRWAPGTDRQDGEEDAAALARLRQLQ